MNRRNCIMVCNGDFKGAGTFKIACTIILQLNVISFYSERGLKSVVTHTSSDSRKYHIRSYPLRTNWLVSHYMCLFVKYIYTTSTFIYVSKLFLLHVFRFKNGIIKTNLCKTGSRLTNLKHSSIWDDTCQQKYLRVEMIYFLTKNLQHNILTDNWAWQWQIQRKNSKTWKLSKKQLQIQKPLVSTCKMHARLFPYNYYILRRKSLVSTDTVCNNFVRQS